MQTLLEILNKTTEYFKKCEVPDPRLDAQYILAKGLGLTRMELYLKFDRPITDDELALMRPMVQRRGKREPLQHILGSTSFRGLEIKCDKRALIPRPETEVLVEKVLAHIAAIPNPVILDIGTGTGAIAIAIASERPDAKVFACDISADALSLARENIQTHNLTDRVTLLQSDLLEGIPSELQFDVIASNPPYIPTATLATLQQEVRQFDPALALDGGADGLILVRKLLEQAQTHLKPGAILILEVGEGQPKALQSAVSSIPGLQYDRVFQDLAEIERFPQFSLKENRGHPVE